MRDVQVSHGPKPGADAPLSTETTMSPHLRIANAHVIHRQVGDWAETETAKDIQRSLEVVRAAKRPALTMIAGSPGVGKTMAVKRFCKSLGYKAIYLQAARGEGTVWNLARYMETLWNLKNSFNTASEARMQFACFIGQGTLVVLDEAQYLDQRNGKTGNRGEAFEWLRAMAEEGRFDLAFVGDLTLPNVVRKWPQLTSRMVRPVIIEGVRRSDVADVVEGTSFANAHSIDVLHAVAKRAGGLRNVENVLRTAQLFAGNNVPTTEHLRAAIVDMKIKLPGTLQ